MLITNRKRGRVLLFLLSASLALPLVAQHPAPQKEPDVVWTWSKQCEAKQHLKVTVRLESKILYEGFLPICRGNRGAENGRAEFHFSSDHVFGGEYRAREEDTIEGDIWQAGGEADALVLGISLATSTMTVCIGNRSRHLFGTDSGGISEE